MSFRRDFLRRFSKSISRPLAGGGQRPTPGIRTPSNPWLMREMRMRTLILRSASMAEGWLGVIQDKLSGDGLPYFSAPVQIRMICRSRIPPLVPRPTPPPSCRRAVGNLRFPLQFVGEKHTAHLAAPLGEIQAAAPSPEPFVSLSHSSFSRLNFSFHGRRARNLQLNKGPRTRGTCGELHSFASQV